MDVNYAVKAAVILFGSTQSQVGKVACHDIEKWMITQFGPFVVNSVFLRCSPKVTHELNYSSNQPVDLYLLVINERCFSGPVKDQL